MSLANLMMETIGALQRGEPVSVRLPNGMTIEAVPEIVQVQDPRTGQVQEVVQLHLQTNGQAGAIEGQLRMSPDTFQNCLMKAQNLSPRFALVTERLRLREANK
jgi:hypothetical protein